VTSSTATPADSAAARTLILLRHAKSDYPGGARDFDRPLAERGEAEATLAGDWLRANLPPVDRVLCSPALRTRQTLTAVGIDAPADFPEEIYDAGSTDILDAIRAVDPGVRTLLVVGHAPGIPSLASMLAGDESDPDVLEDMEAKFPTTALAVLTFSGDWTDLEPAGAALVGFEIAGRDHR
jgi:phosphohistidine phosphatase